MPLIKLQDTPLDEVSVPFMKPMLLRGYCKEMWALDRWRDKEYLREKMQNAKVDVEIYKSKKHFETSKASIKTWGFNKYFDNLGDNNGKWNEPSYFSDNEGSRTYVPDCDLMEMEGDIHPDLFQDMIIPNDYKLGLQSGEGRVGIPEGINLYIGKNTKTGMHCHIEDDFMLNQVVGKKKVYCLDYEYLTNKPFFNKYTNFSTENFFEMDWDKIDIYYAELEPGDSICFPPWIWHAVESDDYTCAITKVWERNDQWDIYKYDEKFLPLKHRFYFANALPRLIWEFVRKHF